MRVEKSTLNIVKRFLDSGGDAAEPPQLGRHTGHDFVGFTQFPRGFLYVLLSFRASDLLLAAAEGLSSLIRQKETSSCSSSCAFLLVVLFGAFGIAARGGIRRRAR